MERDPRVRITENTHTFGLEIGVNAACLQHRLYLLYVFVILTPGRVHRFQRETSIGPRPPVRTPTTGPTDVPWQGIEPETSQCRGRRANGPSRTGPGLALSSQCETGHVGSAT